MTCKISYNLNISHIYMEYLDYSNTKKTQYYNILKQLNIDNNEKVFNKKGKLIICLIEFRPLKEIEHVMSAILKSYNPSEIGIAIMYGNKNKIYIEEKFKYWKNLIFIHKNIDNVDRGLYSALLKQPEFYDRFLNWSHVLIYQTDALIFRKIDDIYFNYDYIGAPWKDNNQWCKYNAGNGGFSLRNIKSCIRVCEINRGKKYTDIHRGNEDGFFCSQDTFNYPNINTIIHKMFSVERVKTQNPIGCHQIYICNDMNNDEWNNFIDYMNLTLLKNQKPNIDITMLINQEKEELLCKEKQQDILKKQRKSVNGILIQELLNKTQILV